MSLKAAIDKIHKLFTENNIDYALIGGFALALHGINRATGDIELLIDETQKTQAITFLNQAGFKLKVSSDEVQLFQVVGHHGLEGKDVLKSYQPRQHMYIINSFL